MWCLVLLLGLLSNFISQETCAIEVIPDYNYRVANGSIETMDGGVIENGEFIKVLRDHSGWAVAFQRLDDSFRPVGPELVASRRWTEAAVEPMGINDVVAMVVNMDEEVARVGEAPCDCPSVNAIDLAVREAMETQVRPDPTPSTQGLTRSLRPVMRPANISSAPISSYLIKDSEEVDQYFACYKFSEEKHLDYAGQYRNSIRRMSRVYSQTSGGTLDQGEVTTLMSCLLFRESWGWRGISSESGAVGLGQFTDVAMADVKKFISHEITPGNFDERDEIQRAEHRAGRLSASGLRRALASIDAERKNHMRFNELRRLWDSIPMNNRPSSSQVNESFLRNNANHEAIIALSSLLVKNCQIRFEDRGYEMDPMSSLLACSGGYNMGPAGIMSEALERRGTPQNLDAWLQNLRNSNHPQRRETHNHLVSIHRCMSDGENFGPCGNQADLCEALPMANHCTHNANPQCWIVGNEKGRCP